METAARILLVDDEESVRASLEELLTRDGYHVVAVESGEAALQRIATQEFDLALVDLKLGQVEGTEVLKALHQRSPETVAIVLTAHASLETAVEALRQGAHDYLFKPCKPADLRESIREGLLSRQQAQQVSLLRQVEQMADSLEHIRAAVSAQLGGFSSPAAESAQAEQRFLGWQGLIVDLSRHVVTLDGHLLDLSPTEFDLLAYLTREAPRVVSPQELVRQVQGYESEQWEASETVRQHVYRIRQKIRETVGRADIVRTVRGVGYTMGEPDV